MVNFDQLMQLLLSKNVLEDGKKLDTLISKSRPKFLDSKVDLLGKRYLLGSFPRSGNSFLRKTLEQVTGIYTGSDWFVHAALNLQHSGLLGEGVYGNNACWITKSHFPYQSVPFAQFTTDKVICLLRNPLDVYPSFLNLIGTTSHSAQADIAWNELDAWEPIIRFCTQGWRDYHRALIEQSKKTPVYYVRYEDLILNPAETVSKLFCFLLDLPSIEGTVLEQRINSVCQQGHKGAEVYKLKEGTGKLNRHAHLYSDAQIEEIKETCKDLFYYFGYAKDGEEDASQFFSYVSTPSGARETFRDHNERVLREPLQKPETWYINGGYGLVSLPRFVWEFEGLKQPFGIKN